MSDTAQTLQLLTPSQTEAAIEDALAARVAVLTQVLGRAPIVLSDMDGVVYEWGAQLNRVMKTIDPEFPIVPDRYRNAFYHLARPGTDQRLIDWALQHPDLYTGGEMTPGADYAVRIMRDIGLDVLFCTTPAWRNPFGYSGKVQFLLESFGNWAGERAIFTHDKTLVFGDAIIDDKPGITGRATPAWVHIVFDRSYNQDFDTGHRIHNWGGLEWADRLVTALEAHLLS